MPSTNMPFQTLVEKLSNFCDYFCSLLNSPNFITQQRFARAMQIKQFNFFSFVEV